MNTVSRLLYIIGFIVMAIPFSSKAGQFTTNFKDCSLTKVGSGLWQAKFTVFITTCSFCEESTNNSFGTFVPSIVESTGKPDIRTSKKVKSPGYYNIKYPDTIKVTEIDGFLRFQSNGDKPATIVKGGDFSINFTTKDNNAYPALFINYYDFGLQSARIFPNGTDCYFGDGLPHDLPPIEEIDPPDPEFKLNSIIWNLGTIDIDNIPKLTESTSGFLAKVENETSNNFCISYVSASVKNKIYSISVTNDQFDMNGQNFYVMNNFNSGKLLYKINLISNDGVARNNLTFPSNSTNYLILTQSPSSVNNRSQMCWTPKVSLFRNNATNAGMYISTLNFVITPKA